MLPNGKSNNCPYEWNDKYISIWGIVVMKVDNPLDSGSEKGPCPAKLSVAGLELEP